MFQSLTLSVFDSIYEMIKSLGTMFVDNKTSMPTDLFLYISLAVLVLTQEWLFVSAIVN